MEQQTFRISKYTFVSYVYDHDGGFNKNNIFFSNVPHDFRHQVSLFASCYEKSDRGGPRNYDSIEPVRYLLGTNVHRH